jgi:hypothetical protein
LNGIRNRYIDLGAELGIGDGDPESVATKTVILDVSEDQSKTPIGPSDLEKSRKMVIPDWAPFASLSAASVALGIAALFYSKRREKVAQEEKR